MLKTEEKKQHLKKNVLSCVCEISTKFIHLMLSKPTNFLFFSSSFSLFLLHVLYCIPLNKNRSINQSMLSPLAFCSESDMTPEGKTIIPMFDLVMDD